MAIIRKFDLDPIRNKTHRRALAAFMGALAVSLGATSLFVKTPPATASVKCKPDVKVINQKGASIKVLRFKYKVGGATVYTEGLSNKVLVPGEAEEWSNQALNHAATGVVVTATAIEYRDDTGTGYGSPRTSAWVTRTATCKDTSIYTHIVE